MKKGKKKKIKEEKSESERIFNLVGIIYILLIAYDYFINDIPLMDSINASLYSLIVMIIVVSLYLLIKKRIKKKSIKSKNSN